MKKQNKETMGKHKNKIKTEANKGETTGTRDIMEKTYKQRDRNQQRDSFKKKDGEKKVRKMEKPLQN